MPADLAVINAKIITMNPTQLRTEAVAIKDGKFLKVGKNDEILKVVGKNTQVIDLKGKTIVPGLIDTHIHVADFGRCLMWLDLTCAKSIKELQNMLKDKVKHTPTGHWIVGRGWNQNRFKEKRMPNRSDLDVAAPDNPVVLYHEAAMICAVNTKALKLAGIKKQTTVPLGGAIDIENGELTGILRDSATSLVWQAVPEPSEAELLEATGSACQKIVEAGLTSVHWLVLSENELPLIEKLSVEGKLPMRVNVVVPEALLEKTKGFKTADTLMLHFSGAVMAVDGYLDSKTAALSEPYIDEPKNRGKLLLDEKALAVSIKKVLDADLQPIIHAMGDRALDTALKVMKQTGSDMRFRMEQAALLNPKLIKRLKEAEVVVSVQPKVISSEFSVWSATKHLGVERAKWLHPLKALLRSGIKVAGGSDCPMEPLSPLAAMQETVLRAEFIEQRLSVLEALRLYTLDSAFASGEENVKGSVEVGKLADLTVLSSDLLAAEPEKIGDIAVLMTIIDGKVVYSNP